jgi:NADPH-dependent F420 reductase
VTGIAILGGTGALGGALALRLAKAGHEVWIGSRDPEKARSFAAALAEIVPAAIVHGCDLRGSAEQAELCVIAVPYAAHAATLSSVKDQVAGKIVIDATVPLRPP